MKGATLGLEILGEPNSQTLEILAITSVQSQDVWRIPGLLLHPNIFGIFLAALLPLAVGAFLLRLGKAWKLFFLATIVLGAAALIATLSRSGWVSFAAAFTSLMFLMMLHQGLRRRALTAAIAAIMTLILIIAMFYGPIMQRIFESKQEAMLGRMEFKEDAKRMIAERPWLGWGLNNYIDAVPPFMKYSLSAYGDWVPPVHHIYYLWWAETGIIGLVLHLSMWGGIIGIAVRNLRVQDEVLFTLNAACLSGMLAFAVDGIFSFSLRINSTLRVFWVLSGIILAVHYCRRRHLASLLSR
jgi:O-antigen ligase